MSGDINRYIFEDNFHRKLHSRKNSSQRLLYHFLPQWFLLMTLFLLFPPFTIYRILVFSSALVKHCFLGNSSGLNLNLTILETSSEPRPRALEESHRTWKIYSLVYLNLTQKEGRRKRVIL